jgi:hypothetical protein
MKLEFVEGANLKRYVAKHEAAALEFIKAGGRLTDSEKVTNLHASLPSAKYCNELQFYQLSPEPKGYNTYRMLLLETAATEELEEAKKVIPAPKTGKQYNRYKNCYVCREAGHVARDCPRNEKKESSELSKTMNLNASTPFTDKTKPDDTKSTEKPDWSKFCVFNNTTTSNKKANFVHVSNIALSSVIRNYESRHRQPRAYIVASQPFDREIKGAFLDSGADQHMFNSLEYMHDVEPLPSDFKISCADKCSTLKATHIGNLRLYVVNHFNVEAVISLSAVLYVPQLVVNLILVSKITKTDEFGVVFRASYADIFDVSTNEVIASGYDDNGIKILAYRHYIADLAIACPAISGSVSTPCDLSDPLSAEKTALLWHRRMGHLSAKYLTRLSACAIDVPAFKNLDSILANCETCALAKSRKASHTGQRRIPKRKLEIIATDILDPTAGPNDKGQKLIVTFIDVFLGYVTAFPIKNKNEAPALFANFCKRMSNQLKKHPIAFLRSDNAPELIKGDLESFCFQTGIETDLGHAHTPALNSFAEKRNNLLLTLMRAMLIDSGLPVQFWPHALDTAVYLLNRSPSKLLGYRTLYEKFFEEQPSLKNLRVFGCLTFAHIPKDARAAAVKKMYPQSATKGRKPSNTKLTPRASPLIFIGYHHTGFYLFDINSHLVTHSCDVTFHENNVYKYVLENRKAFPANLDAQTGPEVLPEKSEQDDLDEESTLDDLASFGDHIYACALFTEVRSHHRPLRITDRIPRSFQQALCSLFQIKWRRAIQQELDAHAHNNTWTVLPRDNPRRPLIPMQWLFTIKPATEFQDEKAKARLLAVGDDIHDSNDYGPAYAPVCPIKVHRLLLSIAIQNNSFIWTIDVTTAYLNSDIDTEVYLRVPPGLGLNPETNMLKLNKAIYSLCISALHWFQCLEAQLHTAGFRKSVTEPCLFARADGRHTYVAVYVDDSSFPSICLLRCSHHSLAPVRNSSSVCYRPGELIGTSPSQ